MRQKYKGKDVIDRLHNTIIRYKNHPYLCTVDSSGVICLNDITNGNLSHKVSPEDEDLDISSINIGYVNIADPDYRMAVYLKREPARRFKQGIEFERLTQKTLKPGMSHISPNKLHCRGFVDAVLGSFPSLQKALVDITKNGWASVAVSRDIAIMRDKELLKVYLKDDEVGFMRLGTLEVNVPKTELSWYHAFLLESIKEWKVTEGIK